MEMTEFSLLGELSL